MELRQLEYFVAVAEEANFTRAAQRARVSQSGISAQIRRLERELGAELIDRSARVATLTPAGEATLEHARVALGAASAVRQAVDDINGLLRGRLRLGMVTGCTVTPLFDAVSTFRLAHPGVEIGLVEDGSDRLIERVRAGDLDAALVGTADLVLPGLRSATIIREGLVAAVPSGHHLGARSNVRLADLVRLPLVCMPAGTGIRTVLDAACARQGLTANVALEASAPSAVLDLAARGLGVAVLSESMLAGSEVFTILSISDLSAQSSLALIWKPGASVATRELIDRSCEAFGIQRDN